MRKVYTGKGDRGVTTDFSGKRIRKDNQIIVTGGKIDALQSAIDTARVHAKQKERRALERIQTKLWQLSAEISHCDQKCLVAPIVDSDLREIEQQINTLGEPSATFFRFTNTRAIAYNECRIRARELETYLAPFLRKKKLRPVAYRYINRLSSYFFMLAYRSRG